MGTDGTRRAELAEAATDYALEHGLIGLSLRPVAAAAGTSDRMLLYHFRDKDDLVATILRTSNDRSVDDLRARPAPTGVREAVTDLWAALQTPQLARCQGLYVQAAALGLLGQEPYASVVREANERWMAAIQDRFRAAGTPGDVVRRVALMVDFTLLGLQLDQPLEETPTEYEQTVADLADAAAAIADQGSAGQGSAGQGSA